MQIYDILLAVNNLIMLRKWIQISIEAATQDMAEPKKKHWEGSYKIEF